MAKKNQTSSRKVEHIQISLSKNVGFRQKTTGFEDVEIEYNALPNTDLSEVNLGTVFLKKKFALPFLAASITGGHSVSEKINKDIALACEGLGIGMGLGSIRAMLEQPSLAHTYDVRKVAPNIFLAANIGVSQLKQYPAKKIEKACQELQADALFVHINAAQEALQSDGSPKFGGSFNSLKGFCAQFSKPVIVKEVGHGISGALAKQLSQAKISALDVAGAGGTSWTGIDSLRGNKGLGDLFWDFGIPTAVSIVQCRRQFKGPIIASGGVRTGLDCAKAFALGADLASMALPVLKAQNSGGSKGVEEHFQNLALELKTAVFLSGAKNLQELKSKKTCFFGKTRQWLEQ